MCRLSHAQRGATLVELLIGMLVGLIVLGITLQMTLLARASYQRIADEALIESRGTQALELLTTALQQAGWVTDTPAASPERRWPNASATLSIQGSDSCTPREAEAFDCNSGDVHGSDAVLVRFAGRSMQTNPQRADDSIIDCSGYGVAERVQNGSDDQSAGYMLLYLTRATDREPQLMCRSRRHQDGQTVAGGWTSNGMVRGVETMQLLYVVRTAGGTSTTTMSARSLTTEQWRQVQAVHIALVVRGDYNAPESANKTMPTLALFPKVQQVEGTNAQDLRFTPTQPQRRRAVFTATVRLRNPLACDVDVC
ncbi:PilW family protein [Ralstonia mojiangensis]|uniref:PilW family protein n=1 Tax=Ralstonia mojiangensis TaxID=2953895 RepID=UPI0021B47F99|nr:PilW family protein [Ralstonia mojiangensis]MCT7327715.1 PilW family protein [Ralstonia mojiangensis]